ncbi:hypothetical protein [Erythrobacter sp. EC-HK427]|uniref:hypothetical protein n=1 Tax=Erythrobacter sp. EC-HK427 TaxID=2038396 RepID=UPI00125B2A55|nr:hypothetical protein [Erythrobacter sp. EC-HK427]VVT00531.1 conserved hypothetical protein [Erythrobacter sp. EC-HK427]
MDDLRELFFRSFEQFTEREGENILHGTSERNLCARWAPLLETAAVEAGYDEYRADTEYNRKQGGQVKTILDETMHVVRITCDLILHSRGRVVERDNLIAIEMKRSSHPEREKQKDRIRLRALTKPSYDDVWSADGRALPEHVCGYGLGYFVELDADSRMFRFEEYQLGNLSDEIQRVF